MNYSGNAALKYYRFAGKELPINFDFLLCNYIFILFIYVNLMLVCMHIYIYFIINGVIA